MPYLFLKVSGLFSICWSILAHYLLREPEAEFMNLQRVLRLEVSVYNVYFTNGFQTTFDRGGGL